MSDSEPKTKRKRKSRFTDKEPSPDLEDPNIQTRLSGDEDAGLSDRVSSTESEDSEVEKMKLIRKTIDKAMKKQGKKPTKAVQDFGDLPGQEREKDESKGKNKKKSRKRKKSSSSDNSSSNSSSESEDSSSSSRAVKPE